jgi:hypothetical protein
VDATDERVKCDYTGVPIDSDGCMPVGYWLLAAKKCTNLPKCFVMQIEEVEKEKPKKKEFFTKEDTEEKKKIIPILDNSAVALLKNSSLKNIKIIFYNKGKLSKDFAKEAELYILEKGVKKNQFVIEIRN